jgi:hypothetical protein
LTVRGVVAGFRDGLLHQLYEQPTGQIDSAWIVNTAILATFLVVIQGNNDKIRAWKQFSKTEVIVKGLIAFLCFWLVRNVEGVR